MNEQQKKNPGATAIATGATLKSEAEALRGHYPPKPGQNAMVFYWCTGSNSVQPVTLLGVSV